LTSITTPEGSHIFRSGRSPDIKKQKHPEPCRGETKEIDLAGENLLRFTVFDRKTVEQGEFIIFCALCVLCGEVPVLT
jgi:hypothetical protein